MEVVVALVVIFMVFAVAMGIYANVMRASLGIQEALAKATVEQQAFLTKQTQAFVDQTIVVGHFTIEKTVKAYGGQSGVAEVHFVAKNEDNKILAEQTEILWTDK